MRKRFRHNPETSVLPIRLRYPGRHARPGKKPRRPQRREYRHCAIVSDFPAPEQINFFPIHKKTEACVQRLPANGSEANFSPQEKRRRTAGRLNASGRVICPGEQHSAAKHHDIANIYLTALHRIRLLFHLLYSNLMVSFCAYLPTMSIGYWKYYQKYISHLTEITLC